MENQNKYNLDDAMTVKEFFKKKGVEGSNRTFFIKECVANRGESDEHTFLALALRNGGKTEDGRDSFTFFGLSRKLADQGEVLNKSFLAKNGKDMMLLEDENGVGTIFLPGGAEEWTFS